MQEDPKTPEPEFLSEQTRAEMKAGAEAIARYAADLASRQQLEPELPPDPDIEEITLEPPPMKKRSKKDDAS